MKTVVALAIGFLPFAAFAQDVTYTNADLTKIQVPGAYTNEDLKKLPPLAVQKAPAVKAGEAPAPAPAEPSAQQQSYQNYYWNIRADRDALQAELDYEISQVEFSESAFAGDTRAYEPRLGYRAQARPLILELKKRVALLDARLQALLGDAQRAGFALER
jgi:hypothetical protein